MEKNILISPVDGRSISLNGLSKRQLRELHYEEEVQMAKMICSCQPFSEERKQLLNRGYEFVEELKLRYEKNVNGSFGASPASVRLVKDIIESRQKKGKRQQIVYEAGVGMGYAVRELAVIPGVKFYGCDVTILSQIQDIMKRDVSLCIHEKTLYEDLEGIQDNFIDVFYADNVIEHLLPDEAPAILKRLNRKMKKGGQLIWFIPNRHVGPQDVSKYHVPKGQKATGFHFMEMGYGECIRLAIDYGFKPKWIAKKDNGRLYAVRDPLYLKNAYKIVQEWLMGKVDKAMIRTELFSMGTFDCYILEK